MVIAQQNGRLRAGDDEDDKDEKQKSKHAVQLMRPEIEHNKYKFIAPPLISILISYTTAHLSVYRFVSKNPRQAQRTKDEDSMKPRVGGQSPPLRSHSPP